MNKFNKDKSLISGKGEDDIKWITANGSHIPIMEGETPKEAIIKHSDKHKEKQDAVKQLVNTLRKIKNIKIKEIHNYIRSLEPISLRINENEIVAEFDKFTADKNVYDIGNSDIPGFNYKLSHIEDLPKYIEDSSYIYSKSETGKTSKQHKGVNQWHYFVNEIMTDDGAYNITVNVRDKGANKYVYEVSFKKKRT